MPDEQQQPPQGPAWVPPPAAPTGAPAYPAYPAYPAAHPSYEQGGHAGPQGYLPSGLPLRPIRGLAIAAAAVAVALALVQLAAWATSWSAAAELVLMARSETDVLDAPLFAYDLVTILFVPTFIAAYVVGCLWLQRARSNAERISPTWPHARSGVWVWLGWWVPVVSWWFPYQMVRDVRAGSLGHGWTSGGVGAWWTCWLVFQFSGQAGVFLVPSSGVPDAALARVIPWAETVATLAVLVALVLWLRLIREITAAQTRAAGSA